LRESFTRSVAQRQLEHAFRLATQLEALEPAEPRWPHKRGDLLRNFGKPNEAAQAYRRAATLYEEQSLAARGKAMRTLARKLGGAPAPITETDLHAMVMS
jgi:predicted RNA polymerase sigma factor